MASTTLFLSSTTTTAGAATTTTTGTIVYLSSKLPFPNFLLQSIKDVQVVPRFIGEWGDVIIALKDGTKVDLRSVPRFREIAKHCLKMAEKPAVFEGD